MRDESLIGEQEALAAAACLFHGFSDTSRLTIVQHLSLGEHRVVDLVAPRGLAPSTVAMHLGTAAGKLGTKTRVDLVKAAQRMLNETKGGG